MPQGRPALIYPDAVTWAVGYLEAALPDARVRDSAPDEGTDDPWPEKGRLITVRDDGGRREPFRRIAALAVNVWAPTSTDARDLAELVAALLENSPGSGRVVGVDSMFGPSIVPEVSGRHHRYLTADLVFTGSALTA